MDLKRWMTVLIIAIFPTLGWTQIKWSIKGGTSLTATTSTFWCSDTKTGGRFGVGMEVPLNRLLSIQPSLYMSFKGGKDKNTSTYTYTNDDGTEKIIYKSTTCKYRENYIELPVNLQFRVKIGQKNALLFAVGPYIAYGIGGNTVTEKTMITMDAIYTDGQIHDTPNTTHTISREEGGTFSKDGLNLHRFDAGLNTEFHIELSHVMIGLYATEGLTSLDKNDNNSFWDYTWSKRNIEIGLEVGYKF